MKSLGFDPAIRLAPDNSGQFIITVHPDNDKRSFRTTQAL
jgi:hypothetical protein